MGGGESRVERREGAKARIGKDDEKSTYIQA